MRRSSMPVRMQISVLSSAHALTHSPLSSRQERSRTGGAVPRARR